MEQHRKHPCIEPTAARKFFMQLDKMTYVALNKNDNNITLHICQPNAVIKLDKDQVLTLLSLKTVIEQTICCMSHSSRKFETTL